MEFKLYLGIALVSTSVFVVKLLLLLTTGDGADTEIDSSLSDDIDGSESFELLSLQSILSFFMLFSWSALALLQEFNYSSEKALLISVVIGLFGSVSFSYLFAKMKKLSSRPVQSYELPKETVADVYSTIPKKGDGYGQVKVQFQGKTRYLNAVSDGDSIPTGSKVKVVQSTPLTVTKL